MRIVIGLVAAVLLIPATAQAWTGHVSVGDQTKEWRSTQVFAKDDFLRLRVFARGREIRAVEASDCVSHLYGMGLAIRADSCGRHLVLRIASSRPIPTRLRIHYYRV